MEMVSLVYDWKPALTSKSFCYEDTICTVSFQQDKHHLFGGNTRNLKRPWSEIVGNDFNTEYYQNASLNPVVDYLESNSVSDKFKVQNNVCEFGYLKDSKEDITNFMEQMLEPETEKVMGMEFCSQGLELRVIRDEYNMGCELNCSIYQQEGFQARNGSENWWMTDNADDHATELKEYSDKANKSLKALKEGQFWRVESAFAYGAEEEYNHKLLVHLLIACAEAISNESKDLAAVILTRLHDLVSFTGNTVQRVAYYFTQSFQYFLEGINDIAMAIEKSSNNLGAFQILYEALPYSKFAHFTANQAILEAIEGETKVHIVDFDILEGLQWPPFMEALALKQNPPHLRITAIARDQPGNCLHSSIQDTGRRLSEFAESLGIQFQFQEVCDFSADLNMICKEEAVVVNCMFGLPHMPARSTKSRSAFLAAVSTMHPKLLTLGEEFMRGEKTDFMNLFKEILHHHCAIFSSMEASFYMQGLARLMVECLVFAPKICEMVGSMASKESEDGEWKSPKSNLAQKAGFRSMKMSDYNRCQAKLLLDMFKADGYSIDEEENEVVLCWDDRHIVSVSQWTPLPS